MVLLQESRLNHKNHFQLHVPGYRKYIKYADIERNSAGGLVTMVKEEFGSERYEHDKYGNLFEHLTVSIRTPEGIIEIQNIYWPNSNPQISRLESLCKINPRAEKLMIAGDFNAHQENLIHRTFRENANQKKMRSLLNDNDLVITNPNIKTTTNGTILDLCIISSNLSTVTETLVTDNLSDVHYALDINIGIARYLTREQFVPRLKFESADWDAFRNKLDGNFMNENILDSISPVNLDSMAEKMAEIYYETATQVIP